jgi:hypothetical protein
MGNGRCAGSNGKGKRINIKGKGMNTDSHFEGRLESVEGRASEKKTNYVAARLSGIFRSIPDEEFRWSLALGGLDHNRSILSSLKAIDKAKGAEASRAGFRTRIAVETTCRALRAASLSIPWFGR